MKNYKIIMKNYKRAVKTSMCYEKINKSVIMIKLYRAIKTCVMKTCQSNKEIMKKSNSVM